MTTIKKKKKCQKIFLSSKENGKRTGVGLSLLNILSVPLSDARSASVGKDKTTSFFESSNLSVPLNGSPNLLRSGGDGELGLQFQTSVLGLLEETGGARHVLVRRVGARTDESDLDLIRPSVLLADLGKLGDGGSEIGSEGTVDVGFEFREVDVDDLVVFGVLVGLEVVGEGLGVSSDLRSVGSLEVFSHALIEGEERGRRADLGTHVTDGSHASAAEGFDTRTAVFDDSAGSALDGEDASNLENNVLGSSPAADFTSKIDTNDLGALEFPRDSSHNVDGVSATDTASDHTETTRVGGMRVGADHEASRESVVFENDLMNDTRAGFPEAEAVFGGGGGKEVVDLLVDSVGASEILDTADLSLDEMVAVDGGGDGGGVHSGGHELEQGHLK